MSDTIEDNSYILTKPVKKIRIDSSFVFKHKFYGLLIKRLVKIDSDKNFWFQGNAKESLSTEKIGPIKKKDIIGKVFLNISSRKTKIFS